MLGRDRAVAEEGSLPLGAPHRQQRNAQDGQCHSQDELQDTMGPSPLYASCAQAARKELEMPPRC